MTTLQSTGRALVACFVLLLLAVAGLPGCAETVCFWEVHNGITDQSGEPQEIRELWIRGDHETSTWDQVGLSTEEGQIIPFDESIVIGVDADGHPLLDIQAADDRGTLYLRLGDQRCRAPLHPTELTTKFTRADRWDPDVAE